MYAAFDNHKNADFAPYLLRSTDAGKTWTSIAGDLPARGSVLASPRITSNPKLLFVGTEFGLYVTLDGGKKWTRLKGGLPTIAVTDLGIQRPMNDLVVGTFGRGFYVLDDYSPLRARHRRRWRSRRRSSRSATASCTCPAAVRRPRQGVPGRDVLHGRQPARSG